MKINKLETWFSKLWFISTSRKCASHALLWFPSSMVDAKQTIRDTSIWGGGSKEKTRNHVCRFINMICAKLQQEINN